MCTVTRLFQQKLCAAGNDLFTEGNEGGEQIKQCELFGLATAQRNVVDTERALKLRETPELIKYNFRLGITLQFDDNAHAFTRAFIANIGNAFYLLIAHHFSDFFDHRGLVGLIWNFCDDQREAVFADGFSFHAATHDDGTPACAECISDARAAKDDGTSWEVWARNDR